MRIVTALLGIALGCSASNGRPDAASDAGTGDDVGAVDSGGSALVEMRLTSACVRVQSLMPGFGYPISFAVRNDGGAGLYRVVMTAIGLPTSPSDPAPRDDVEFGPFQIGGAGSESTTEDSFTSSTWYTDFTFVAESSRPTGPPYAVTSSVSMHVDVGTEECRP